MEKDWSEMFDKVYTYTTEDGIRDGLFTDVTEKIKEDEPFYQWCKAKKMMLLATDGIRHMVKELAEEFAYPEEAVWIELFHVTNNVIPKRVKLFDENYIEVKLYGKDLTWYCCIESKQKDEKGNMLEGHYQKLYRTFER